MSIAALVVIGAWYIHKQQQRRFAPLPELPAVKPTAVDDANLFLYIGDNAFEPDVIDITVALDGDIVIVDKFTADIQVPFTRYRLSVAPGEHRISAVTIRGEAHADLLVDVEKAKHVSVRYFFSPAAIVGTESPPQIMMAAQDEPWMPKWAYRDGN